MQRFWKCRDSVYAGTLGMQKYWERHMECRNIENAEIPGMQRYRKFRDKGNTVIQGIRGGDKEK